MNRDVDAWGRVTLNPNEAFAAAYQGLDIWSLSVDQSPVIDAYNLLCDRFDKARFVIPAPIPHANTPEEEHRDRAASWLISDEIKSIAVRDFLLSLCSTEVETDRVNCEMDLFEERDLIPLLQLMMYLVDYMRRNKIVWGVGRGSSVSSFCLYLIGIHRINSIRYSLSIEEFLK